MPTFEHQNALAALAEIPPEDEIFSKIGHWAGIFTSSLENHHFPHTWDEFEGIIHERVLSQLDSKNDRLAHYEASLTLAILKEYSIIEHTEDPSLPLINIIHKFIYDNPLTAKSTSQVC